METKLPRAVEENLRGFIKVPQTSSLISVRELFRGKCYNRRQSLDELAERELEMSLIFEFMSHRKNVCEASKGKRKLVYADGTEVRREYAKELWDYLSSTDRGKFSGEICWSSLNARFEKGSGFLDLDLVSERLTDGKLVEKREPLKKCLMEDCYAGLKFNSQGLLTGKSVFNEYEQNKNIHFYFPGENSVARFVANSRRASLIVSSPSYADSSLGVFASVPAGTRSDARSARKNSRELLYTNKQIDTALRSLENLTDFL